MSEPPRVAGPSAVAALVAKFGSALPKALLALPLLSLILLLVAGTRLLGPAQGAALPCYALVAGNALVAVFALLGLLAARERRERSLRDRAALSAREREHVGDILRLEHEIDLLSAMRDVTRILNDDVQFERIWERVLEILRSIVEYEEVTIFVREVGLRNGLDEVVLIPRVHHREGRSVLGADIDPEKIDLSGVAEALEHRSAYQIVESDVLSLFFPLSVDQENMGVLKVTLPLTGDARERGARIDECQAALTHLLKHLSLAIKTPTLYDMAVLDHLTGLNTKRYLLQQLDQEFRVSRRHGTPFVLVLLDIDHFKSINDTHGHLSGDLVLSGVAGCIRQAARESDTCYRYGGEEMCVLLPESKLPDGLALAERLRGLVERTRFRGERGQEIRATVSLGIAPYGADVTDVPSLISRADQSLYRAKDEGRNQAWCWGERGPEPAEPRPAARASKTRAQGGRSRRQGVSR
ncbi:MAG: GGDEF domain-containing protein [Planctomycetes bacterium]|nr:GGDEF domain-containing protein [Planctomycetota bacterium]